MGVPSPAKVDTYQVGDPVRLVATFTASDLVTPADPSYVTFYVQAPYGSVASYPITTAGASVTRVATGAYVKEISIPVNASAVGDWRYRGEATGLIQAAQEWRFRVEPTFLL